MATSSIQKIGVQHMGKLEEGYLANSYRDVTNSEFVDLRKPKVILFYIMRDNFFKGLDLRITPHRYATFDELINDLTRRLFSVTCYLPMGVRRIYSMKGELIRSIDHLEDSGTYLCAGLEPYNPSDEAAYSHLVEKRPHDHGSQYTNPPPPKPIPSKVPPLHLPKIHDHRPHHHHHHHEMLPHHHHHSSDDQCKVITPRSKTIKIIRNGSPPRSTFRIKIHRSSVHSLPQLLTEISEALTPRTRHHRLQKLYTLSGRVVHHVDELFRKEDTFIGVCHERLTRYDLEDILDEMYDDDCCSSHYDEEEDYIDDELDHTTHKWSHKRQLIKKEAHRRFHENSRKHRQTRKRYVHEVDSALEEDFHSYLHEKYDRQNDQIQFQRETAVNSDNSRSVRSRLTTSKQDVSLLSENERATHRELERLRASLIGRERARLYRIKKLEDKQQQSINRTPAAYLNPFTQMDQERENARIEQLRMRYAEERLAREKAFTSRQAEDERLEMEVLRKLSARGIRRNPIVVEEVAPRHHHHRHVLPPVEVKSITTLRKNSGHSHHRGHHHHHPHHHHHHHSPRKVAEKQRHQGIVTWIINLNELQERYKIDKKLGDGNYAVVREAIQTGTMKEYASKIVEKSKLDARDRQMIAEEIRIMRASNHPNLVRLYEVYETASDIYMIMESLKSGDLFDDIKQKIKFSEKQTAVVGNDLANALFYLHSRNIVHRDLKPENVLVIRTPRGLFNVKLCDFGLATEVREPLSMICGTPTYVAPEILEEKGYGLPVDLWALGVIIFVMLSGYPPFRSPERSQDELFEFIKAGEYEYLSPYWDNISESPKELIDKMLIVNPIQRFTAIDVLCHPWIMQEGGSLPLNQSPTKEQIANHREDLQKRAQEGLGEFQSLISQAPPYPIPPRPSSNIRLQDLSDSYDY